MKGEITMKKTLALFLAVLLLLLACAGCSEKSAEDPSSGSETAASGGEAAPASPEDEPEITAGEERVDPGLPEDLDFGGHVFTIMNNCVEEFSPFAFRHGIRSSFPVMSWHIAQHHA